MFYFNRQKTVYLTRSLEETASVVTNSAAFNETIQELEDDTTETEINTQAKRIDLQENITQIRDELNDDDIKKMMFMKKYHQEIRNSLRHMVDERNEIQITEILEKFSTFERNFEIILKGKRKDNSDLLSLQQDLELRYKEIQRHYKETQRLLQPIIQSNDEIKQSIERINNDIHTGFKEIEENGPTIVEIRENDIKSETLAIEEVETAIPNSTSISKPDFDAQSVVGKVIPDNVANEETMVSTSLPIGGPDIQPILAARIRGQDVTDQSKNGFFSRFCSML